MDEREEPARRPAGDIASIRGALDTFDAPADAQVAARIARLDADAVVARVLNALLSAAPDPLAVFADLAAEATRPADSAASEQNL